MNEIETFYGLVENTLDALRIFQMCRDGRLNRVRRRLHERERRLIRSGSVFVFDEEESGIRRWTDGRLWSPSRILGNFLIYRELEKKGHRNSDPTSKTKGGTKRTSSHQQQQQRTQFISHTPQGKVTKILPKAAESLDMLWGIPRGSDTNDKITFNNHQGDIQEDFDEWIQKGLDQDGGVDPQEILTPPENQRSKHLSHPNLHNRNVDPTSDESLRVLKSKKLSNNHKGRYIFKSDGLIKKTISIQLEGHTHHLVAYYSLEDFCKGHLQLALNENSAAAVNTTVNEDPLISGPFDPQLMEILRQVPIPVDLMLQQNFRKPAALLASATSNVQNLMTAAGDHENGEKLITALEYGAINPSDLQTPPPQQQHQQQQQHQHQHQHQHQLSAQTRKTSTFVSGGGIIFSSSPTIKNGNNNGNKNLANSRPRRHSSFHPMQPQGQSQDSHLIDSLNLLDESSQLSGEALEFLSHFSDEHDDDDDLNNHQDAFNFLPQNPRDQDFAGDLETELFGSILSSSTDNSHVDNDPQTKSNAAIRGHDVLLSDTLK